MWGSKQPSPGSRHPAYPIVNHRPLFLLVLVAVAGCSRSPQAPSGVIPREKFVAANVALRILPDSAPKAEREATLKKQGMTERQLLTWVAAQAREPQTLAETWQRIAFQVDSLLEARPVPGVPGGEGPATVELAPPPPPTVRDVRRRRPVPEQVSDFDVPPVAQ